MPPSGDILKRLDWSIGFFEQFLSKLRGTTNWEVQPFDRPFPYYLQEYCESAKRLLLDLGKAGRPSLVRVARRDFGKYVTDKGSPRWVPSKKTLNGCIHDVELVKAQLEKSRAKLLGISRTVRQKKSRSRIGRPRKARIDLALRLLDEGMQKHTADHPDPSERWEWVFENEVCSAFQNEIWPSSIDNWTATPDQTKKAKKNLRDALRRRGGIGVPPRLQKRG